MIELGHSRGRLRPHQTNDPADVEYEAGATIRLPCRVRSISDAELRLELRSAIGPRTPLRITFLGEVVVVGESLSCEPTGSGFVIGVVILALISRSIPQDHHIGEEHWPLYLAGRGLTVPEVIALREHLRTCGECLARLDQIEKARDADSSPSG